ncbi:hypothetical protein ABPG72_008602 [Tetrahymena utriculariae]
MVFPQFLNILTTSNIPNMSKTFLKSVQLYFQNPIKFIIKIRVSIDLKKNSFSFGRTINAAKFEIQEILKIIEHTFQGISSSQKVKCYMLAILIDQLLEFIFNFFYQNIDQNQSDYLNKLLNPLILTRKQYSIEKTS